MLRWRKLYILPMFVLLSLSAAYALAQEETPVPPQILAVQPYPGEEMPPDSPLTIVFNQPMNQASVEAAWSIEPAIEGTFTWPDARTLVFTPAAEWPREAEYRVTIGVEAAAENGLTLPEAYTFTARTVGNLTVASVIPAPDTANVAAEASITVAFNRPVVPLVSTEQLEDLPQPLRFEPDIPGTGEWVNTSIYSFTPAEPLLGGATYTAIVEAGLTDLSGASLAEAYTWQFSTLPPEILSTSFEDGRALLLDETLSITFSQPMNQEAVEASIQVLSPGERPVEGAFSWSEDSTVLTFTPSEPLTINAAYRVVVTAETALGVGGAPLRLGRDARFTTIPLPYVESTYPGNGESEVTPGTSVYINFGTPMNTQTLEGRYRVEPEPEAVTPVVSGDRTLYLSFVQQPETTYTVTLLVGAEDIYGNAIPADYTFRFTTGRIDPYVSLTDQYQIVVTGSYRETTTLPIVVAGQPQVQYRLYSVDEAGLWQMFEGLYGIEDAPSGASLLREWEETFPDTPTYQLRGLALAEDAGALPPGSYYFTLRQGTMGNPYWIPAGVVVANSNVTFKRVENDFLIWVTDMQTAQPLAEQEVSLYLRGNAIATGRTDSDGLLRLTLENVDPAALLVVAQSEGRYGVWYSGYAPQTPEDDLYFYTDRPIYRPGETVYFRGVYRAREDMDFSVFPPRETMNVVANVNYSQVLFEESVTLTEFGTFSGEFVIPPDSQVGYLTFNVSYLDDQGIERGFNAGEAQVAEFRVPEFRVEVTPSEDEIVAGDPLRFLTVGTFFSGGAVNNAQVTWYAQAEETSFNYTGEGRYSFSDFATSYLYGDLDYYGYSYYSRSLGNGEGVTDGAGGLLVELTNTTPDRPLTERVTFEASLYEESGQVISNRATAIIHPSSVYVGLNTDRYFGEEGEALTVNLITVTPESEIVPNHDITLTIVERRWERIPVEGEFGRYTWQEVTEEVLSESITTDENGQASYLFTPEKAGRYSIVAETRDDRERLHRSSRQVYVFGSQPVWWGRGDNNTLELQSDKESYVAGETAQILVPIPFSGVSSVLVTVEREGVLSQEVLSVEGSTLVYDLPLTEAYAPTVYFSVTVLHGIDDDYATPQYRQATIALTVAPTHRELTLTVTPSTLNAQPGETVTIDVLAQDAEGQPVQAEVGLALVDAAILTLAPPNSVAPTVHYYGYAYNYTQTENMMVALIDGRIEEFDLDEEAQSRVAGGFAESEEAFDSVAAPTAAAQGLGGGGGGGGFETVTVRSDFQQTPLWEAHLVTDAEGRAQTQVTMPDNLTIWHLTARAMTQDTLVGEQEVDIQSTLPLLVRPATPRFFVVGDEVSLGMVVNNNTDAEQTVQTTLQGTGFTLLEGEALEKSVTIAAGERARVEWRVRILDTRYVDLTFIALGADGYQDASKPPLATGPDYGYPEGTIPVYRYTAPDTVGTSGVLFEGGSRTEGISLPPFVDSDQGDLLIQLDPSLAATTVDALAYLENFPHQCIEQTVSRFLPNVVTYRALRDLGVDNPELEANLLATLNDSLQKLYEGQNSDGGWGWFVGMESNPIVTAYAVLGLIEARNAGFEVDENILDLGVAFIRAQFITPTEQTEPYLLNRQAFYYYVLARAEDGRYRPAVGELDNLFRVRLELSHYAKALLLMAYTGAAPEQTDAINSLTSDLLTAAILSATGAHWEEPFRDWWNWGSDTRTTAIVLRALLEADPDNPLLPNAVRWLMVARQGDRWETTQENTWAVLALTDWMVATDELQGQYSYALTFNGAEQTTGEVTPENVREGQELSIAVGELLADEVNRVTVIRGEGQGALYYTAHLNLRLDASQVEAIDRGVAVSRQYFDEAGEIITSAAVGDVVNIRVTITVDETLYYFVLEDPLPAGLEGLDTSLLTTTQGISGPELILTYPERNPYYYWYWWVWDRTEMRDEQVNLYADILPPGTYVYSYQARATTPGAFQTMPSHGYAFYFPEVFGRGDGTLFTVTPAE